MENENPLSTWRATLDIIEGKGRPKNTMRRTVDSLLATGAEGEVVSPSVKEDIFLATLQHKSFDVGLKLQYPGYHPSA